MTNSVVTDGIVLANALAVVSIATATELNPILECFQNGASVGAIMGIFLWREVKRAERYENLYNEERRLRHEAESKCATCQFVQRGVPRASQRQGRQAYVYVSIPSIAQNNTLPVTA